MKLKHVLWFAFAIFSLQGLAGQSTDRPTESAPPPKHPVVEAPDGEWDGWRDSYSTWYRSLDYRTGYDVLTANGSIADNVPDDCDWRFEARYRGLTYSQIQQLGSGGVIATGRPFAGLDHKPDKPLEGVFVTSDMLLHAYNMMTADFVRAMEMQRAPRLRRVLEKLWDELDQWPAKHRVLPERAGPAICQAKRVIGTAVLCLGGTVKFKDSAVERDCLAQHELILAALASELPKWLEPADGDFVGIDYMRLKPVGFYAENETLTRLFRAVRWLQVVPFRPERDTELVAFAILAEAAETCGLNGDDALQRQWLGLPNSITTSGQSGLSELAAEAMRATEGTFDLKKVRKAVAASVAVHANDDVRFDPQLANKSTLPPMLKILPAYLTADSLLFSEVLTCDSVRGTTLLPEGRMITAYLGDSAAITELTQAGWKVDVLDLLGKSANRRAKTWAAENTTESHSHPFDDRTTFNSLLLNTWSALFLPPAKGAPSFMLGAAWRAKSRNAVLAAWAEKKHTWVLHEVEPSAYLAGGGPPPPPPGLIEPNPEFFRRLAFLTERTKQWMEENGYLQTEVAAKDSQTKAVCWLRLARGIRELKLDEIGNPNGRIDTDTFLERFSPNGVIPDGFPDDEQWAKFTATDFARMRETALRSAEAILQSMDPESQSEEIAHPPVYRRDRWECFLKSLRSLETMSEKQLRGEDWNAIERDYLTSGIWYDYYRVIGLADNGERPDPKSVGPKIAPVASNPNSGEILHVGTGDMAEIYVLYPWKGHSFLYRGPIVPYFEFVSKSRLNDEGWRSMLNSATPPNRPPWLTPLNSK